jgi:hypothetical protein
MSLVCEESGRVQPCQVEARPDGTNRLVWIVSHLAAGEAATYRVQGGLGQRRSPASVRFVKLDDDRLGVKLDRSWLGSIHLGSSGLRPGWSWMPAATDPRAEGADDRPDRGTDELSIWVGHGDVNGVNHAGGPGAARARVVSINAQDDGTVAGRLALRIHWESPDGDGASLLEEWTRWTVYQPMGYLRMIDLAVWLRATTRPVEFGPGAEVALPAIRVTEPWTFEAGGRWQNTIGGKGSEEISGRRADWITAIAATGDRRLAIFVHPSGFGAPPIWRLSPDGLLTADPFPVGTLAPDPGSSPRRLAVGSELGLHLRFLVHSDHREKARVPERYLDYAYPPTVASMELP